jgi:hypothetical protein
MSGREEANEAYSEDPHYNGIVKDLNDFETIPEPPEKAKNAFAITLFCMEAAFDSRSKDFLKHAFDRYFQRNDPTDGLEDGLKGILMEMLFDTVCGACGDRLLRTPAGEYCWRTG